MTAQVKNKMNQPALGLDYRSDNPASEGHTQSRERGRIMATNNPDFEDILHAYVTGLLSESEAETLERSALTDPDLAAEIALARGLVAAGVANAGQAPPNEFGWARLTRAIGSEPPTNRSGTGASWPRVWQIAATAVVSVALWQVAVMPVIGKRAEPTAEYEMAGAAPTAPYSARATLVPTATEQSIRTALVSARGSIVAGPSALGVYTIAFRSAPDLDLGILELRANAQVIETIEPEG